MHAYLGRLPDGFLQTASALGPWREIGIDDLGHGAARTLQVLAIGLHGDSAQVLSLVPSLRASNPALVLIGLPQSPGTDVGRLANLMDETLHGQAAVQAFVNRCLAERHGDQAPAWWRRWGGLLVSRVLPVLCLLVAWELAVAVFRPAPYLLPAPSRVLAAFLGQPDRFVMHTAVTAFEALAGFLIGNALGITVAVMLARFVRLHAFTMPILISLQAIPIVAFAPLLGVWLGTGYAAKVGMAALICFFPMVVNTLQAFANVDADYRELFRVYRASFSTMLRRLLIPASAPAVIAALKISAGLAVVGAIVAEMTGADRGLGYLILNGAYRLETDVLFVAMLLSGVLGVGFYLLPDLVRPLLPRAWRQGVEPR